MKHEEAFGRIVIVVRGEKIDLSTFKLRIDDVDDGMINIGADIAWASALYASAQSEADELDAVYRHWRANYGKKLVAESEKAAQWKIEQDIEASNEFLQAKRAVAEATRAAIMLRGLVDALKAKTTSLMTKGGYNRALLEAEGASVGGGHNRRVPGASPRVETDGEPDAASDIDPPSTRPTGKEAADLMRSRRIGKGKRKDAEGPSPETTAAV